MLRVQQLNGYYGDSHILHGLEIDVPRRGRVAVLGRNGAGKSTLLKSIMNAGPRVTGEVTFESRNLAGMPTFARARAGLSFVPEDRRIFSHLTVVDNLRFGQIANRKGAAGWSAESLLQRFSMLEPLRFRMGDQLSGGQQQMLAVARGFASDPKLVLLDEPTEGLAPIIVKQLAVDVRNACDATEAALLLCEQNLLFARSCTDHVYVIDNGQIVFSGNWALFDLKSEVKEKYLAV